ncbi:MAG: putative DNA binding domain-containing protein [Bacteroidales bacterium]|nr:putative DNA binding domain-containing protein [Bacteroidales bacterium]
MKEKTDQLLLDLVKRPNDYVIYQGDHPLLTSGGFEVANPNGRLLKHILTDLLMVHPNEPVISLQLYEIQRDILDKGSDPVDEMMTGILGSDPFVMVKTGKSRQKSPGSSPFGEDEMNLSLWIFSELLSVVNTFFEEWVKQDELAADAESPFAVVIRTTYSRLSPEEKSAIIFLIREHEPGLVLPLFLATNRISPAEYSKGMVALTGGHPQDHTFSSILHESSAIRDYIMASEIRPNRAEELESLISLGESNLLEFKSTLRWDLRHGKTAQHIERAVLKTISAFLNSEGGTLLIGIRDDGSAEGIESDRLQTEDRWLLHLWTLIRTCFGRDVTPYITTKLEKFEGKTICLVECSRSLRPVFLKQPGFEEEFYIRIGPASAAMSVSEALKYIADHFHQ